MEKHRIINESKSVRQEVGCQRHEEATGEITDWLLKQHHTVGHADRQVLPRSIDRQGTSRLLGGKGEESPETAAWWRSCCSLSQQVMQRKLKRLLGHKEAALGQEPSLEVSR